MRAPILDLLVTCVIGLLGLAVFAACGWVLCQSGILFVKPDSQQQAMGIAGLIVASGIMFAGMSLVLRLRPSREDHPPRLGPAVMIICLGGAVALGAVYLDRQTTAREPSATRNDSALAHKVP